MTLKTYATVFESGGHLALRLDSDERLVYDKILGTALSKGKRVQIQVKAETKERSTAQLNLYWALLTLLHQALNFSRRPTEEEKNALHEEIKEIYGNRKASLLRPGKTRPIGMSEADVEDAGALIDGVMMELAQMDLNLGAQQDARELWQRYWSLGGPTWVDEADFRARSHACAACGQGGDIQLAHIESRGANTARRDDPANWLPLCPACHREQHQHGWRPFLGKWPHLEKRVLASLPRGA